jgi:polysaccharide export outer membrane protein
MAAGLIAWGAGSASLAQSPEQPAVRATLQSASQQSESSAAERLPAATPDSYTLGAGDQIRVDVFRLPQYGGEMTVLVNGLLNLPVVGSVSLQGLTLEEAEQAIAAQYARILRNPIVTVTLVAPRPLNVSVTGEVSRPGSYKLDDESSAFPTLTQVLEVAGGVRQSADLRQVQIRRPQRNGTEQIISVNLWEFLQIGDSRSNLTLRDGDTVFVPTASAVSLTESPQIASASFAAAERSSLNIAVVGEVFRPGSYVVTGSARTAEAGTPGNASSGEAAPSITRAIQIAGGITPTADIRNVEVRRLTRAGDEQAFKVDLWQLLGGDLSQDAILQDRDTVVIPKAESISDAQAAQVASASFSPNTIQINVVGEVIRPGAVEVPPNSPLNQALLTAGGFNNRANRGSVELIRLNPNGTVSRRSIEIDLAQGINEASNPALRNNDVIVVKPNGLASLSDSLATATSPFRDFFNLFSLPFSFFRLF